MKKEDFWYGIKKLSLYVLMVMGISAIIMAIVVNFVLTELTYKTGAILMMIVLGGLGFLPALSETKMSSSYVYAMHVASNRQDMQHELEVKKERFGISTYSLVLFISSVLYLGIYAII